MAFDALVIALLQLRGARRFFGHGRVAGPSSS
jgi:hypothetical protein